MDSKANATSSTLSLGLSFLFVGIGFALPVLLFPFGFAASMVRAPEILNVFCLVAWAGLAHFYFAYRGHLIAIKKNNDVAFYGTVFVACTWFVINDATLFSGALVAILPMLYTLAKKDFSGAFFQPLFLIGTFLIGEGLLWGKYRPDMTPGFRDGVYTIHVALASFYHYFKSYFYMRSRQQGGFHEILIVNSLMILTGILTLRFWPEPYLILILGPQFFTVWVWLHQWMSDVFNWRKNRI